MTAQPTAKELVISTAKAINGHLTIIEQPNGLMTLWVALADKADLVPVAHVLKSIGARLSMITALADDRRGGNLVAYHFDIEGITLTIKVRVASGDGVDSIMPIFRNADWHEREFMEFYDIKVDGREGTPRLFLDESVDSHVMERLIPLSILANAASTKVLWERLTEKKEEQ